MSSTTVTDSIGWF